MENKPMNLGTARNRISTLKYSQLRKIAKRYSVNANQKKEVLIMELSKVWPHSECNKENIIPKKTTESKVTLSCSSKSSLNDTLNQTFTIERDNDNDMDDVDLSTAKLTAANGNSIEKKNILQRSQEANFLPLNVSNSSRKMEQNISTPCKDKSVARGALVARFAALHQKLAEKQPTLQEADANVKRKFAEHERSVPDTFKRLATPKVLKKAEPETEVAWETTGHQFKNVDEDPSKMDFSFPKLYGTKNASTTIQYCSNVASQSKIPLLRRKRMPEVGVKKLTKNLNIKQVRRSPRLAQLTNSITVPQLSTRLQRLANPKGKNSEVLLTESEKKALRKYGRRYVPYRHLIPYVDTTKMTDSQFHEAKKLGQVQTLTAISASRTETRQQLRLKRDEARERILKAKRGC
uniref:SAP domain-containing protein n=1 Tax=Wuchereria bancrofti TaxID=6293 RepID=A0AAF5Q103_WUCBA